MPVYQYKAAERAAETVKGTLTAESEDTSRNQLADSSLYLISASESSGKSNGSAREAAMAAAIG